ncbi:MAG: hypothetical protein ACTSUB_06350 [Candidatus Thorarchaeota archaeon]
MPKKTTKKEYEDIIRFRPKPIHVIKDERQNQYLWEWHYNALVRCMKDGPMTVQEITEAFNIQARFDKFYDEKSSTSIYRYLKTLEKEGLVAQAGKRVFFEKHKTEILYSRTAIVFYYINLPKSFWESDAGRVMYERIYLMVSKIYPGYELDKEKFNKYIIEFERAKEKQLEEIVGRMNDDELYDIMDTIWWQVIQVLRYSDQFAVSLNQPEMLEKLKKCFKKEKKT